MNRSSQILVVTEDEDVTRAMTRAVIELGYGVSAVATTGEEAIIAAAETSTVLALVDAELPGEMDGVGVGKVLENTLRLPFIYAIDGSDSETFRRARLTRPYGYVLKPVQGLRLRNAMELALQRAALQSDVPAAIGQPHPSSPYLALAPGDRGGNGNGNGGGHRPGSGPARDPWGLDSRDPLTLLENRGALEARARKAIEAGREGGERKVALVLVDLIGFSEVNQELGKRAGDEILEQVARRLQLRIQPGDGVARLEGGHFGVLFTRLPDLEAAHRAAGLLLDAFGPAFHASHWPVRLRARVALAVWPDHTQDVRELMDSAGMALASVKDRREPVLQVCKAAAV